MCSDVSKVSRASRRRRRPEEEKSVSIKTPKSADRHEDGVIKIDHNHDDDSRHWPKETETFATSECTRISNEDLGKFHADLEAHLNLKKWFDPARCSVIGIQSLAYVTPLFFLLLPRLCNQNDSPDKLDCDIGCEGKTVYQANSHTFFRLNYLAGGAIGHFTYCFVCFILAPGPDPVPAD